VIPGQDLKGFKFFYLGPGLTRPSESNRGQARARRGPQESRRGPLAGPWYSLKINLLFVLKCFILILRINLKMEA